jgi:uncharacterized protein
MPIQNKMLKILTYAAGGYALLLVTAVVFQKKIAFRNKPLGLDYTYSFVHRVPFEEAWLRHEGHFACNYLYFRTDSSKRQGLVLYFHGNADNLARWGKHANDFTRNGYDVLMMDYPQFGKSTGTLSEENLNLMAEAFYAKARERFDESQIVLYGRSLGTGIATKLAVGHRPKMLLLETPYTNLPAVGRSYFPLLPYELISRVKFHTDEVIGRVSCPMHLFHGTADRIVPYEHSLQLAALLQQKPETVLTTLAGGKHKNLATYPAYHAALDSCLRQ